MRDAVIGQVRRRPGQPKQGVLNLGGLCLPCAIGKGSLAARKREGDGATPLGRWPMREVFYRPDRVLRPSTGLPLRALRRNDGWCDDPADRNYNRNVSLPYGRNTETMWRDDYLYDLVVVLGYNDWPRKRGAGSAIFMHLARDGYTPTEGCVALSRKDLLMLLSRCGPGSAIEILP